MAAYTANQLKLISNCPLFAPLDEEALAHVLREGNIVHCTKGEELCWQRTLSIVLKGRACIKHIAHDGHEVVLDYIAPGRVFGAAQIFLTDVQLSQVVALSSLELFTLDSDAVEHLLELSSAFSRQFIIFLSNRVQFLTKKIETFTGQSIESRLLYHFYEHANEYGVLVVNSFTGLASLLNIGRASLYRALDMLKENGTISIDGRTIELLNN